MLERDLSFMVKKQEEEANEPRDLFEKKVVLHRFLREDLWYELKAMRREQVNFIIH